MGQIPGRWKHAKRTKKTSPVLERDWPTYSPQGKIQAFGRVARAARFGRGSSRRAAHNIVLLAVVPGGVVLIVALIDALR